MIFEMAQISTNKQYDRYTIKLGDTVLGEIDDPKDAINTSDKNVIFYPNDINRSMAVLTSKVIHKMFRRPVLYKSRDKRQRFVVKRIDSIERREKYKDVYVLWHSIGQRHNESVLHSFDDIIGTVFKNKKNIVYTPENRWGYSKKVSLATHQLAKEYKHNVLLNIRNMNYTITPKTAINQIIDIYDDFVSTVYYNKKPVGISKYSTYGIEFLPYTDTSLPNATNGALLLQKTSGQPVTFIYPNKQYKILMKLYARELNRKQK